MRFPIIGKPQNLALILLICLLLPFEQKLFQREQNEGSFGFSLCSPSSSSSYQIQQWDADEMDAYDYDGHNRLSDRDGFPTVGLFVFFPAEFDQMYPLAKQYKYRLQAKLCWQKGNEQWTCKENRLQPKITHPGSDKPHYRVSIYKDTETSIFNLSTITMGAVFGDYLTHGQITLEVFVTSGNKRTKYQEGVVTVNLRSILNSGANVVGPVFGKNGQFPIFYIDLPARLN